MLKYQNAQPLESGNQQNYPSERNSGNAMTAASTNN